MSQPKLPTTLQEAIKYFADSQRCLDFAIAMRWPTRADLSTVSLSRISLYPNSLGLGMQALQKAI